MGAVEQSLVVVAGVDKAGSSSLAWGVVAHPDVAVVEEGEGRQGLRPAAHLRGDAVPLPEAAAFVLRDNRLFADATAPERIARLDPTTVVVSLREPVARIASMYRHRRALGRLPLDLTLDEFARRQLDEEAPAGVDHRVVAEGRYARYLPAWFDAVGRDRVSVVFLEEWRSEEAALLRRLAGAAGVDPAGLPRRAQINESGDVRFPRVSRAVHLVGRKIEVAAERRGRRDQVERVVRSVRDRLYTATLVADRPAPGFSADLRRRLEAYYREENERLSELLGRSLPWSSGSESASGGPRTAH